MNRLNIQTEHKTFSAKELADMARLAGFNNMRISGMNSMFDDTNGSCWMLVERMMMKDHETVGKTDPDACFNLILEAW